MGLSGGFVFLTNLEFFISQKNMRQKIIEVIRPFFLFLTTFYPQNVYNMFATCWILISNLYELWKIIWGVGEAICLASQYDVKTIIALRMTCFDQLNPTSQGCGTIIDVPTLHLNKNIYIYVWC